PQTARLDDDRPAQPVVDAGGQVLQPGIPFLEHGSLTRQPGHDRNAGMEGDDLRDALVHPDGGGQNAAPHVSAPAHFEQTLDAAVFPERSVEDRDKRVDRKRSKRTGQPSFNGPQRRRSIARRQDDLGQPCTVWPAAFERARLPEVVADPPASLLVDIDRERRKLLGIDRVKDLQTAHDRHIMFERAATKDDSDRPTPPWSGFTDHRRSAAALFDAFQNTPDDSSYRSGRSFSRMTRSPVLT